MRILGLWLLRCATTCQFNYTVFPSANSNTGVNHHNLEISTKKFAFKSATSLMFKEYSINIRIMTDQSTSATYNLSNLL